MNKNVLVLALGTFALGTDTFIIAGVLPRMAADLGVPMSQSAYVVTLFSVAYALSAPLLATFLGAVPRKELLVGSMFVFTLANIVSMQSWNLPLLLASRVVAAVAASAYSPAATASAAALSTPALRGRAIATVTGGLAVATVLGVPLGTMIGTAVHWRAAFLFVIALGGIAMVLLIALVPTLPTPPRIPLSARFRVWFRADIFTSLLVTVASMTGVFAVYTFIGPLVARVTVLGGAGIAAVLLVYGVGAIVGNALGGLATDRVGANTTLSVAIFGLFVSLLSFALLQGTEPSMLTTYIVFGAVFVWGAVGWGFNPAQSHRLLALGGAQGPVALAGNVSAIHVGVGLGATLGGVVVARAPITALGLVGGGAQLVALAFLTIAVALTARRSRPGAGPDSEATPMSMPAHLSPAGGSARA